MLSFFENNICEVDKPRCVEIVKCVRDGLMDDFAARKRIGPDFWMENFQIFPKHSPLKISKFLKGNPSAKKKFHKGFITLDEVH